MPGSYTDDPSNFINNVGQLNDTMFDFDGAEMVPMWIRRQAPDLAPCSGGICPAPSGGTSTVGMYNYLELSPVLCAVPAERFVAP